MIGQIGGEEAAIRSDDENTAVAYAWRRERVRVSELAAKIESAQESKDFAQGGRITAAQTAGEFELGAVAHEQARPLSARVGRREKKNALH